MERHLLTPSRSAEQGVRCTLRFRDDLLVLLEDICFSVPFRSALCALAGVYCVVGLNTCSLVGVPFLDLFVFKSNPDGSSLIRWRPFAKPSARRIPLSNDSYHAESVHRSWPVAEMMRMSRRSCDEKTARHWQLLKLNRFQEFLLRPSVLDLCRRWRARLSSQVALSFVAAAAPKESVKVTRIVVPFRRELVRLPAKLKALWALWRPHFVFETNVVLDTRVSWAGAGRPLFNCLW